MKLLVNISLVIISNLFLINSFSLHRSFSTTYRILPSSQFNNDIVISGNGNNNDIPPPPNRNHHILYSYRNENESKSNPLNQQDDSSVTDSNEEKGNNPISRYYNKLPEETRDDIKSTILAFVIALFVRVVLLEPRYKSSHYCLVFKNVISFFHSILTDNYNHKI